jgi:hypothetical protein
VRLCLQRFKQINNKINVNKKETLLKYNDIDSLNVKLWKEIYCANAKPGKLESYITLSQSKFNNKKNCREGRGTFHNDKGVNSTLISP